MTTTTFNPSLFVNAKVAVLELAFATTPAHATCAEVNSYITDTVSNTFVADNARLDIALVVDTSINSPASYAKQ